MKFSFLLPSMLSIFCILQCFLREEGGIAAFMVRTPGGVKTDVNFNFLNVSQLNVLETTNENSPIEREAWK